MKHLLTVGLQDRGPTPKLPRHEPQPFVQHKTGAAAKVEDDTSVMMNEWRTQTSHSGGAVTAPPSAAVFLEAKQPHKQVQTGMNLPESHCDVWQEVLTAVNSEE